MSRAHLFRPLQDAAGNLQRGATVRILRPGTTTEVASPLYVADDGGTDTYSQPINCPDGFLSVFLDQARRVRVGVTPFGGGTEVFFDDIDVVRTFQDAAEVPLDPVGGLQSLDVQSAIAELQTSKMGQDQQSRPLASQVPYDGTSAQLVATDVQGAIDEVKGDLDAHLVDTTDAHDASAVSFVPAGTITATDVQAALEDLDAAVSAAGWIYRGDWTVGTAYLANNVVSWKGALYLCNASHTATAPPTLSDNFDRANGLVANGWNVEGNDAEVDGNRLRIGNGGVSRDGLYIIRKDLTTPGADISVHVDLTYVYSGYQGMVVALDPVSGHSMIVKWGATVGGGIATLDYWDGTTAHPLGSFAGVANQGEHDHRFKYDPADGLVEFWQDGNSKGQFVVPSASVPGLGTWAGLGSTYWLLFFDNLSMAPVGYAPDATKFVEMSGQTSDFPTLINLKADQAALTAHINAADPHPQYLTQAEGDARYTASTVSSVSTVDEEGVALTQRPVINFVGRRVTATDDAANNRTNVVVSQPFVVKTANYTLTANDDVVFFQGTSLTATLPTAVGLTGVQFTIKNQDPTDLALTSVGGTIDADASRTLPQYDSITVVSDGTNWGVI